MEQDNNDANFDDTSRDSDNGIKFEEDNLSFHQSYKKPTTSRITRWVIKFSGGLIKNEKQASYVLLAIAVVAIGISVFILVGTTGKAEIKIPAGNKMIYPTNAPAHLQYPVF